MFLYFTEHFHVGHQNEITHGISFVKVISRLFLSEFVGYSIPPHGHSTPGHLPPRAFTPLDIYPLDIYPLDNYPPRYACLSCPLPIQLPPNHLHPWSSPPPYFCSSTVNAYQTYIFCRQKISARKYQLYTFTVTL